MVNKIVTWIVVADGARARVFVNDGIGKGLSERPDLALATDSRRNRDIQADRPGRTFDSAGEGRHAMEPRTDPHQHDEREFIRDVVDRLNGFAQRGAFERLVLVAAPRALGDMRQLMPKPLSARVVGTVAKDLTKAEPADIETHLEDIMAV